MEEKKYDIEEVLTFIEELCKVYPSDVPVSILIRDIRAIRSLNNVLRNSSKQ